MGRKVCDICGCGEAGKDLVPLCACYKKQEDGGGLVHLDCYRRRWSADADDVLDRPTTCPRCKTPYRISLDSRFSCDVRHCCRIGVLRHLFDMVVVIITFCCVMVTMMILDWRTMYKDAGKGGLVMLSILLLVAVLSVFMTVHRVYARWKNAASDTTAVELDGIV